MQRSLSNYRTFLVTIWSHRAARHLPFEPTSLLVPPGAAHPRSAMKVPTSVILAAFSGLLCASCYQVPVTGRRAMNLVDDKEVTKMSISMFDDMKKRYRPSRDKDRIEQLARVGDRLAKVVFWDMPDADWEVVVFDVPQINAFAMAGGKVGVFSGLFKIAKTDDELAPVIGHEIAHVTAKHVHEKLSRELAVSTVGTVGVIGGIASGVNGLAVEIGRASCRERVEATSSAANQHERRRVNCSRGK